MRYEKLLFFIIIVTVTTSKGAFGSSFSPEDLVRGQKAAASLAAGEPVTEVQTKKPVLKMLPKHDGVQKFVRENKNSLDPNILVETLWLYKKPQALSRSLSEAERVLLFNKLTALSSLSGIEYYSESRGAMRIFYETSCIIDSPSGKKPLPDPVFLTVPDSLVVYTRQKDLTFGENIYRFNYNTEADAIYFLQENLTTMKYGKVTAIKENNLKTIFAFFDAEDYLLLYVAAMAKTASIPGMSDRIGASFTNRTKAVYLW